MRFSVAAMLAAVDRQMEADATAWQEKQATAEAESAAEVDQWWEEYGPAWREAWRHVGAKLRKHQPIVTDDLPRNSYRQLATFRSNVRKASEHRPSPELVAFRTLLGTIADEEVTSAGLRELGVTSATMRRVVLAMAPSSINSR